MDDKALGEFLRHRRERLRPEDVGLPGGGRRRTPGLRREEVAGLAALSPDYYGRLEQGRVRTPSAAALASLARAIRLTGDEQDYLFRLAGQQPPEPRSPLAHVDPAMLYLLDVLPHTPAQVTDDLLTVVAQNRAAVSLFGVWTGLPGYESNVTWRWFADPASRDSNDPDEHERIGRAYAADLRAGVAQRSTGDRFAQGLVADLLDRSAEFRTVWERQEVVALASAPKLIRHPLIGELDLQCDVVLSPSSGHRLILFRPRPGSDAHDQIAFLGVLGNQNFA
ncbi:helix-turn-helix transcriptional regulator [Actinoplanes couchii]|uniref:XRE family transcriptional regulator n=1 Tax=Actinoplanes couchii TaxID=403638 RepID=A0ABQ3XL50_9ACTN|nr:helix-turn-helix transcriptional regulator [Actinoplanes couchii]MDR6318408.1 transcriptional regulator with XRE-family HTH domain [Actinoplanes couchii]GID59226.1 XRE family transcriptional regulator [Actinoplanes couchii]